MPALLATPVAGASIDAEVAYGSASGLAGFSVLYGTAQPDARLADYQWSASARPAWGLQALVAPGRFAFGVRHWSTVAEQKLGVSGAPETAVVRGTSWEAVGRGRLARFAGNQLLATASAGRLHLEWDPERVTNQESGTPIVVELRAIDEWIGGAGLVLERRILGTWNVGIGVERRFFALDAAHRDGDTIVERREIVGDWNARVELARLFVAR